VWEDRTLINTAFGIAVTHGADRPAGAGVFAAIPNTTGVAANQPVPLELARSVSVPVVIDLGFISVTVTLDTWQRFTFTGRPITGRPMTSFAKPGLTYSPFSLTAPLDGRFYLTSLDPNRTAFIVFTEGNDTAMGATNRRLMWMLPQNVPFADDRNQQRTLPNGVVLARFGASVAGATSVGNSFGSQTHYFPAADGIYNAQLRDYDEAPFVLNNLRCSLSDCE
jgi:hypothetical protein